MRTILGTLIGLGLGVALVTVLSVSGGWDGYWTMIPVGLVVGVAMRVIASQGRASIGRGVLSLLAAMGALPLGQMVAREVIQNQAPTGAPSSSAVASAAAETTDEPTDDAPAAAEPVDPVAERGGSSEAGPATTLGGPQSGATSPVDIVCLVIGALLSYQVGKGPETVRASSDEGEAQPEGGDAPAPEAKESGDEG